MGTTRMLNLPTDMFEQVQAAAEQDGVKRVGEWLAAFLRDYGFDSSDTKVLIRVPQAILRDRLQCEQFLLQKVQTVLDQFCPPSGET